MVLVNRRIGRQPRQSRRRNRPEWEPPTEADEPIPGLVPVGGGFFATPSDAVSPFDCERWPDSPYCGGNPFTRQPVGFNFSRVQDECNIGIQVSPVLGFVKLPISQLVYRKESCRIPEDPPPKLLKENKRTPTIPPPNYCGDSDFLGILLVKEFVENKAYFWNGEPVCERNLYISTNLIRANKPVNQYIYDDTLGINALVIADITLSVKYDYLDSCDEIDNVFSREERFIITAQGRGRGDWVGGSVPFLRLGPGQELARVYFTYEDFLQGCNQWDSYSDYDEQSQAIYENLLFRVPYVICGNYQPEPPPPDDRDCECMCCDDSLLRLLLSRVNKIYTTVGVDDYPVSVPQWITKDNSPQTSIANITRFISYTIKQLDAISGNYPIKIKIQDADLTEEGNQEKTVTLPNAAEALAEIVGLLLTIRSETNASLIASINGMIEAGSSKQLAFIAQEYAKANAEFLGYKGKQVERELPYTFTPNESQLDKMMKPKTVKVKGWENDDKDDFTDAIAPLLELAAMWKAQNFRNLGASSPIDRLREILKGANDISAAMSEFKKNPPRVIDPENPDQTHEPIKDEWDTFVEEAERGFIAKPGITDNTHPYGRPLDQRPRIREIGDDTSDTNNGGT